MDFVFYGIILGFFCFGYAYIYDWSSIHYTNFEFLQYFGIFFLITSWFYFAFSEYQDGGTFGKTLMRIHVTNKEGDKITLMQSTLRWLGKIVSELFFFFGNFWFYFDKARIQTFYDKFSKTIVIKK